MEFSYSQRLNFKLIHRCFQGFGYLTEPVRTGIYFRTSVGHAQRGLVKIVNITSNILNFF